MENIIKIKNLPIIKKKFIGDLKKISNVSLEEDIYIFKNISNKDLFLHRIAYEMIEYLYNNNLKEILLKHFDSKKVKEILENHEEKSYEKNHLAFLLKIKLTLFLKNNDLINFNSFLKFNAHKILEEIQNVADLEIDADGEFLKDEENLDSSEKYVNCIEIIRALEMTETRKAEIGDIHVFKNSKGEYKMVNEANKQIKINVDSTLKEVVKKIYGEAKALTSFEYMELKFIVALGFYKPERIILYASLDEQEEEFIKDFAFFKQGMNLDTECYKSTELEPSI